MEVAAEIDGKQVTESVAEWLKELRDPPWYQLALQVTVLSGIGVLWIDQPLA